MSTTSEDLPSNPGEELLSGMIHELLRRLRDPAVAAAMTASEMELIRKICTDNSITIASIRKGPFMDIAKKAGMEEQFPFDDEGMLQ